MLYNGKIVDGTQIIKSNKQTLSSTEYLGLVTDGNTKLCCRGFVLALFQSTTTYEIDSGHARDYTNLLRVCKVEILEVTVNKVEVLSAFKVDFCQFSAKSAGNS